MVNYVTSFISEETRVWAVEYGSLPRGERGAWRQTHPMPVPDITVVADHIEYIRDLIGVDHVGIGSDFDGIESTPTGLEDVSTFPRLIAELLSRGWTDEEVRKVIGLNVLRVMREVESVAARLRRTRNPSTARIEIMDGWGVEPEWDGPRQ
jgi:membrane dipeptidase